MRVVLHQLDIVKTMLLNRMDGAPVNIASDGEPAVDHGTSRARMAKSS